MRSIRLILVMLSTGLLFSAKSQEIDVNVEEVRITMFNDKFEDTFTEDHGNGPLLTFKCHLKNNTDEIVEIDHLFEKLKTSFTYKKKTYCNHSCAHYSLLGYSGIQLAPGDELEVIYSKYIFLGTKLYKNWQLDYREELFKILPSLSVIYEDKNIRAESKEIERVIFMNRMTNKEDE